MNQQAKALEVVRLAMITNTDCRVTLTLSSNERVLVVGHGHASVTVRGREAAASTLCAMGEMLKQG